MADKEMECAGSLRVTNPETLQKWIDTGKYQKLIFDGWIYAPGCGRFRMEECQCRKCKKKRNGMEDKILR